MHFVNPLLEIKESGICSKPQPPTSGQSFPHAKQELEEANGNNIA